MLLAGDIGGTKTVLAVFSTANGPHTPLVEATFPSNNYDSLESIIGEFLQQQPHYKIDRACFGVAGPIVAGTAQITNLPWTMSESSMQASFVWSAVRLLNDLEALAYAIPILEAGDLYLLNAGTRVVHGNIAVIAPGTGLGEAFMTWEGTRYRAHASEGGHTAFAPANDLEIGLLTFMRKRLGRSHVSNERVCSGLGIPNIYDYLKSSGYAPEPDWLAQALADVSDPTPVIMNSALGRPQRCALTTATLQTFLGILGGEAGNLALKVFSTGGVYLGGGIPPRLRSVIDQGHFFQAFCNKGRFSDVLTRMPIQIILNPKAALLGAAAYGLSM